MHTLPPTLIYRAAAIRDASGRRARPGTVAVRAGRILAAGPSQQIHTAAFDAPIEQDLGDYLIVPGMVNAHCHLDLNEVGQLPYEGSFVNWVRAIQAARATQDETVAAIVTTASNDAWNSGVDAVGDIAAGPTFFAARQALASSALGGVSFAECLGVQPPDRLFDEIDATTPPSNESGVRAGLQPHAPYSTAPAIYHWSAEQGRLHGTPLATHLAELLDEVTFVRQCQGPFRSLLESLGRWTPSFAAHYGNGKHPVDWVRPFLAQHRWLLVHCNYLEDDHLPLLASLGASVAYCPIASDYFGHRHHRYRELLDAGVNVCLGTDSIVCQFPDATQPLGILEQMRYLHRRDATDPDRLLAMATTGGASALGLPHGTATLQPGATAGLNLIAIDRTDPTDPLVQALEGDGPSRRLEHVNGP